MQAFVTSLSVVALSEMGDKTQLLALALATKFRKPWIVMLGILIATVLNHALAAGVGAVAAKVLTPTVMGWILVVSFLSFAVWTLKPDELDDLGAERPWGPLVTTIVMFFLAEMGDKTQFATIALGARFPSTFEVVLGTTLGMMLADGLAVVVGETIGQKISMRAMRYATAGLFALMGIATLVGLVAPGMLTTALR